MRRTPGGTADVYRNFNHRSASGVFSNEIWPDFCPDAVRPCPRSKSMSDTVRSSSLAARFALSRFRRSAHADDTVAIGPRGRLFRTYVLLIVGLVSLVLLLNSALDFWFSYEENKAALFRIQQEKAGSAARRIEQFIDEIERQLGWTTAPQWAASPLEQRRFDYGRLLRQVPPLPALIQLG